jgi:hypothetical protein
MEWLLASGVKAGVDQRLKAQRVALEVVRRFLPLLIGDEIIAVGDDRLEIEKGEVSIDLAGNARQRVLEAQDLAVLAEPFRRDGCVIEAGIADEHDSESVGAGSVRLTLDGRGVFGTGAWLKADGALELAAAGNERDDHRCGAKRLEQVAWHDQPALMSWPRSWPVPRGRESVPYRIPDCGRGQGGPWRAR